MKKVVRLTEADLTRIIKRVISEATNVQSQEKIMVLRNNAKGEAKMSPCWTKGMCPRVDAGKIYRNECEVCAGPIAGILIPTVGAITGAIIGITNRAEQQKRRVQENEWIKTNPELQDRTFTYFKDGSVQASKDGFAEDVMILEKGGTWKKLSDY
jgi:hypothetical protein